MPFTLFIRTFATAMTIHKDCIKTILWIWIIAGGLIYLLLRFVPWSFVSYPLSAIFVFIMGFSVFFFRVPDRKVVKGDKVVTSVADGEIVVIEKVFEPEHLGKECIQVSVYMDFFNVHVNFWPISGECTYYKYHPGKYMLAYLPKASELNEHASVSMNTPYGDVFFKQIAGTFARRIVTYAEPGENVRKADECGIIKFGSRIDMFLPLDAKINVKIGEYVKASESVIAELSK